MIAPDPDTPLKILIVDDDADLRAGLLEVLQMTGMDAVAAASAEEALACLSSTPAITVMLTDLAMPGIDGLELAARVRDMRPKADAVEIVILTGRRSLDTAPNGIFQVLRKPVGVKPLLAVLHAAHQVAIARRQATRNPA